MHFTIITPSLNYGRFLVECLESVAGQLSRKKGDGIIAPPFTLKHLVIDGGSTDDSAAVAGRFHFSISQHLVWA